jgi:hypothetical protein
MSAIMKYLAFSKSVIKSGEDWTTHCQESFDAAMAERDELQSEVERLREELEKIRSDIQGCPVIWDQATMPISGFNIEDPQHRQQVVGNLSICYERLQRILGTATTEDTDNDN